MARLIDRLHTDLLFDKGVRMARQGEFDRALGLFEQVLSRDPDVPLAHANAGFCHAKLDRPEAAFAAYERARALDPEDPQHVYDVGCLHHAAGRREQALEAFREALRIEPEFLDAYTAAEQVRVELGLPAEAGQAEPAAPPDPTPTEKPPETRQPDPEPRKKPAPAPDAATLIKLGLALYERGSLDEALRAWGEAARLDPDNAQVHNNRAAALFTLGRHAEAVEACTEALRIVPGYAIAHMTRGEIYAALGNHDAVMREFMVLNPIDEGLAKQLLELIKKPDTEGP